MTITSNLKAKGYRVEGGTTLFVLPGKETEEVTGKWIKVRITPEVHKELKKLAVDEEISLAELFKKALKLLLKEGR